MENPIDHTIDLGFVNYVQHPTNPNYIVYRFVDQNRADSFEKGLKEREIWFEKENEDKRGKKYYLFGIHKNDYKKNRTTQLFSGGESQETLHTVSDIPIYNFVDLRYCDDISDYRLLQTPKQTQLTG